MNQTRLDSNAVLAGLLLLTLVRPARAQGFEQFFDKAGASPPTQPPTPAPPAPSSAPVPTPSAPAAAPPPTVDVPQRGHLRREESVVAATAAPTPETTSSARTGRGIHFVVPTDDADGRWQVVGPGNVELCALPCERPLADTTGWNLRRTSRASGQITDNVALLDLRLRADSGALRVQPRAERGSVIWIILSGTLGGFGLLYTALGSALESSKDSSSADSGSGEGPGPLFKTMGLVGLAAGGVFLIPALSYRSAGFDASPEATAKTTAPLQMGVTLARGTLGLGGSF